MKTEVVRVRLTELEKQKLMDHAESMNMSMSDYIKYCCLVEPPMPKKSGGSAPKQNRSRYHQTTRPLTDSKEDQELLAEFLLAEQDGEPPEQW